MYTRTYNAEGHGIVIPESYGGTLLRESEEKVKSDEGIAPDQRESDLRGAWNESDEDSAEVHKKVDSEETFSFISKIPFSGIFTKMGLKGNFSLQKIGAEEILIIATALFLLFSKDGDKECAIMLLLLLLLG